MLHHERSCPACGLTFVADRRRIWCSDACRQRGCGVFCPHCDEPVALSDLVDIQMDTDR